MEQETIFEMGDSLEALALFARDWFNINNVSVPTSASNWQKASVRKGEIPPGTGVGSLRRRGFNVTTFISHITENPNLIAYVHSPILASNIEKLLGLRWISDILIKGHKKVLTECANCMHREDIDYGTLQRMNKAGNTFCRYCRNAGGKPKDLVIYDIFKGFTITGRTNDKRFLYSCNTCNSIIERTGSHVSTAEYLVCEICYPKANFGCRMYTDLGYFDSKIEYEAYKILLKYLPSELIVRQKKYNELFNTGTKHTADFYIPIANLVLEVTSDSNNLGSKYKETAAWKLSLSDKVQFAYSLQQVEDIVRPIAKVLGQAVGHSRNVLCRCLIR